MSGQTYTLPEPPVAPAASMPSGPAPHTPGAGGTDPDPGTGSSTSQPARRYYRKVIRIRAEDSPNVRYAMAQQQAGLPVTNTMIVPGVITWSLYRKRRATWDAVRQCVGLDGQFYEGAEVLMYPPEWLNLAERRADALDLARVPRWAVAIGIDPAEGGANTSMAAVDHMGLIELVYKQTPDTSVITNEALAFMRKHQVEPEQVIFDRGGGGKQHVDILRDRGYPVRSVAFGESLVPDPKSGMSMIVERIDTREQQYAYRNRRSEMYGKLRELLDISINPNSFGLPAKYTRLRQQLAPIPLTYDPEGRLELLPKNKRDPDSKKKCLIDLIGYSPDEADAVVLAVHGLTYTARQAVAGAI